VQDEAADGGRQVNANILRPPLISVKTEISASACEISVDGTLIQAWASHKSLRRKNGSDDGRRPEDWRGEPRSNDTHASTSDPESQLYRKSDAAPALPSYLGHVLTDNRHGLVVNVQASTGDGTSQSASAGARSSARSAR
jgi:hypothetical protein